MQNGISRVPTRKRVGAQFESGDCCAFVVGSPHSAVAATHHADRSDAELPFAPSTPSLVHHTEVTPIPPTVYSAGQKPPPLPGR